MRFFLTFFFFPWAADVSDLSRLQLWNMELDFWMNKIQDRTQSWRSLLFKVFHCVSKCFISFLVYFNNLVHKKWEKKINKQKKKSNLEFCWIKRAPKNKRTRQLWDIGFIFFSLINKICGILSQVIKQFILGTVYLWTWLVSIWFTASVNLITLQQILCPLLGTIRRCVALVTPTYLYASRIGTYWPCTRKRISGNCRKSRLYFRSQIVCVVILQIWWRCSNLQNWNDAYDYFWKLE